MAHWSDARPAWLWAHDGQTLLWRNEAARFFLGKVKKHGVRFMPEPVPIRGQIARLLRLGSLGRSSLSRIQLLAGGKPISMTCTCTPLNVAGQGLGLLIVGVDPIDPELLVYGEGATDDPLVTSLLPEGADYLLVNEDSQITGGSSHALATYAEEIESEGLPGFDDGDSARVTMAGTELTLTRFVASPHEAMLLLFEPAGVAAARPTIAEVRDDEGMDAQLEDREDEAQDEPLSLPPEVADEDEPADSETRGNDSVPPEEQPAPTGPLASLFDRLADDDGLYGTLSAADETYDGPPPSEPEVVLRPEDPDAAAEGPVAIEDPGVVDPPRAFETEDVHDIDVIGALIEYADEEDAADAEVPDPGPIAETAPEPEAPETEPDTDEAEATPEPASADISEADEPAAPVVTWRVIGRGFVAKADEESVAPTADTPPEETPSEPTEPRDEPVDDGAAEIVPFMGGGDEQLPVPMDEPEAPSDIALFTEDGATEMTDSAEPDAEAEASAPDGSEPHDSHDSFSGAPDDAPADGADQSDEAEQPDEMDVQDEEAASGAPPDADTVDRVSRYNFDELTRILTDRVAAAPTGEQTTPVTNVTDGGLVNLAGETFILNRLPLGILVFRDQQVLFANRALTELTGHTSIESLRNAGLTSVFPSEDSAIAGPVTHLLRSDGELLPVSARLQSISWHGKPALMLSASEIENRLGHEGAVRTFSELAADLREDGYVTADRAGIVTHVSLHGRMMLGQIEEDLIGKPLAGLVASGAVNDLRQFLELPARFAETARPAIQLPSTVEGTQLHLFAAGQAGIVNGYFGFIHRRSRPPAEAPRPPQDQRDELEPSMLVRISRGVRRPLNTVIGFAEMIRSGAIEPGDTSRIVEYARDIKSAGEEIAALVDELDDYARLREGRYELRTDELELTTLLETCLMRVRGQAATARVLVRSAISERLPNIIADRPSLTQALLNLLASAIDQTPPGGTVILSAQLEDDGAVVVNVRDNGARRSDLGERFVVFRDGVGKEGEALTPVRSSVGLALTRSLLAVNTLSLNVDPAAGAGTLFSLVVPAELARR
ncbi:ATP-binding protein [Devosia sp.]|uniref:ATP-binding protein n=1 Tax=Devosia sp. TaxID=1871048 RepID=UPI003A95DAAE